ncbi:MAG TPA: prenyltransferase/squalene oxidase repeat-containing protein [Tepidisphaeraceae bacterium]|jgi:hypothetical protein
MSVRRPNTAALLVGLLLPAVVCPSVVAQDRALLPKHMTPAAQKAIKAGLDVLAKTQSPDGNWTGSADGATYGVVVASLAGMAFLANGNTPSRGPYAENVRRAEGYVMSQARESGLICSAQEVNSRSMYGHGFGLLFLASVYGMESDDKRRGTLKTIIDNAVKLTATAQSSLGGWTYVPGDGDEGSVTITQMQALRAANNAGFTVPKGTTEAAIKYLEKCQTPEGGIMYSFGSDPTPLLAISAAALASMYNAGDYESKMADTCLAWVHKQMSINKGSWSKGSGHDFYTHLYASQSFYQAGDKYWDDYFPPARDQLVKSQGKDGAWEGDVGPVYGTSIALIILQLPYKYLPIYQR